MYMSLAEYKAQYGNNDWQPGQVLGKLGPDIDPDDLAEKRQRQVCAVSVSHSHSLTHSLSHTHTQSVSLSLSLSLSLWGKLSADIEPTHPSLSLPSQVSTCRGEYMCEREGV